MHNVADGSLKKDLCLGSVTESSSLYSNVNVLFFCMGVYENPIITFLRRKFHLDSFKFVTVYNVVYVYSILFNPCLGRISRKYTLSQRSRSSHFTSVILKILEGILKIRKKVYHPRYLHCKKLQVEFLYLKHIHNKTHTNIFF